MNESEIERVLIVRLARHLDADLSVARSALDFFAQEKLALVSLRHVGWVDINDHSLLELDTDSEYRPPDCAPVWLAGRAWNLPVVEYLDIT